MTVVIVGVGLIGGSFALGLRRRGFQGRIVGVSSPRTLAAALQRGVIDEGAPLEEAVPQADLVYLAQPVGQILEVLPEVARLAQPGTLVTDAGSTKEAIVARAGEVFRGEVTFLGGHPMAGKAERGVEAAEGELFRGASYVLTPSSGVLPSGEAVSGFCQWLEKLGARVIVMRPEVHDRVVALTSHLPQLASTALAAVLAEQVSGPDCQRVAGGGLRDMTRLAASAYQLWRDICRTNADNIDRALSDYIAKLEILRRSLREPSLETEFRKSEEFLKKMQRAPEDSS